jgi:C1A family cysteine protease
LSRIKIPGGLTAMPPGSYSLLDNLDYVPEERDQGRCGSCWVWASTGMTELDLAYRKGIKDRLSIQYFLSNCPNLENGRSACCGGFQTWFADSYNAELSHILYHASDNTHT